MSIIEIKNLKYRYPGTKELALDSINLTIEKGEFIGIAGANGAGKSTLSQAIMGLVPQFHKGAYGGSIEACGLICDKTPVSKLCERVGLVFQNPFNQLTGACDTVYKEVAFGMQNLGIAREEMHARIEETLKLLDIWEYRDRNPFDLSGGQTQRVAIASTLVMKPEIMILDEPTSQLDPAGTEEVFKVISTLAKSGITIIMIEQKLEKLAGFCDRILLMHKGRVVDFDIPSRIFAREDLESIGVCAPVYTQIAKRLGIKKADETYPVTQNELINILDKNIVKDNIKIQNQESLTDTFKVTDMSFSYIEGIDIFNKLNLKLDNRTTAIIGQNGAGKTTLVRILKGLLKPVSGNVYFHEEDISNKTVAMLAGTIGYVFQNPDDQIFKSKVIDEVMFGPLKIGFSKDKALEQAKKALEMVKLLDKANANPYDLELHERKMVAIASIIAMDTEVVILDEPTIAQDYLGKLIIGNIIKELKNQGKLVIAILHDMDFVSQYFDRVVIMAKGQILSDTSVNEAFRDEAILEKAHVHRPFVTEVALKAGLQGDYLSVEDFILK